jgi:hypothetical protein
MARLTELGARPMFLASSFWLNGSSDLGLPL